MTTATHPGRVLAPPAPTEQPEIIPLTPEGIKRFIAIRKTEPGWSQALLALGDLMQQPIPEKKEGKP